MLALGAGFRVIFGVLRFSIKKCCPKSGGPNFVRGLSIGVDVVLGFAVETL